MTSPVLFLASVISVDGVVVTVFSLHEYSATFYPHSMFHSYDSHNKHLLFA